MGMASSASDTCSDRRSHLGEDRDSGNAQLPRGFDHAAGNLSPVGDEQFLKQRRNLQGNVIVLTPRVLKLLTA